MPEYGLGRIPSPPDAQDNDYPFARGSALVYARAGVPFWRYYRENARLDQNGYPHCVGYGSQHFRSASPFRVPGLTNEDGDRLYADCKMRDNYDGPGTYPRVALQIMRERGWISNYFWAQSLDDTVNWLRNISPIIIATVWTDGMDRPDRRGFIRPEGEIRGGHLYLLDGINVRQRKVRIFNSWGEDWGIRGRAWLTFDDLESLVFDLGGEAIACTEVPVR